MLSDGRKSGISAGLKRKISRFVFKLFLGDGERALYFRNILLAVTLHSPPAATAILNESPDFMFQTSVGCFFFFDLPHLSHALKTCFKLSRVKFYGDDLKGDKSYS